MKRPHKILKSPILGTDLMYKQIYTYDPLLNLIEFHDKSEYDKLVDVNESTEQSKKKGLINEKPEKKIAIMTSGKETSGMNAAIRALVRCGLTEKITPYIVFNGYKGKFYIITKSIIILLLYMLFIFVFLKIIYNF